MLSRHPAFADLRVSPLHGKMPSDEKDAVMQSFARGDIDVLIATTVVEVGVDVPERVDDGRSSRPTGSASRSCTSCADASAAAACPGSACS